MHPVAPTAGHARGTAVRRFGWLTLLGASCALAGGVYALTGRGIPCPVLLATGWQCPLCGASRMGAALLRGDPAAAWVANPFVLVLGGLLLAVWAWSGVRLLTRRSAGLPTSLGRWLERGAPLRALLLMLLPALVWMLARNLI